MAQRRFQIEGDGRLVDREGFVLGRVTSMTIDVDPATMATLGVGGHIGGPSQREDGEGQGDEGSGEKGDQGEAAPSLLERQRRIWSHFLVATGRDPQKPLTPSNQRLISKAMGEHPDDVLIQAIDGLVAHVNRKGGNSNLSRVFKTRPGGSPLGEQIEWFAQQSPSAGAMTSVIPSEVAASISDAKQSIRRGVAFPGNAMAQRQKAEAEEYLESVGVTVAVVFDPMSKGQVVRFSDEASS